MTIVELIQREHEELADLFDHLLELARDKKRAEEAAQTASRLVAQFRIHALAEERVVYAALREQPPPLKPFALAGPHAHEDLDTTLDKLFVHRPEEDEYEVIVRVARDQFDVHARDDEEGVILPAMTRTMSAKQLARLARDMLEEEARIRPYILRLVGIPASAA